VKYISLQEAIKVIEENGGIPVLAHPGINVKENSAFLETITDYGIGDIEVYK
jgi:3',5'-nucleoside bisphosphate phosphatase